MIEFLFNPLVQTILALTVPILILPVFMRFAVSRVLLFSVKKKYLPGYLNDLVRGWEGGEDKKALDLVSSYALKRMKYHFVFRPDFINDMKAVLLCIKNFYDPGKEHDEPESGQAETLFSFSITTLAECALLAFSDMYREFGETRWFRAIRNLKLVWFFRFRRFRKLYRIIFSNPVFEQLKKYRLAGKIIRILLIPVIGLPELVVYALRSVFIGIFLEGFFRFFYGLLILKFGYYALYLYGRKNTHIRERIASVPKEKLKEMNEQIQQMILPSSWEKKSDVYPDAAGAYLDRLEEAGVSPDTGIDEKTRSFLEKTHQAVSAALWRIGRSMKKVYRKHNPFSSKTGTPGPDGGNEDQGMIKSGFTEIRGLVYAISSVYVPESSFPLSQLRIGELLLAGYMASVIVFHRIFSTPGLKLVLDQIPVNFVLKVSKAMKTDMAKTGMIAAKQVYKYYRLFRIGYRAYKIARGVVSPVSLVWTLANPVIMQQIRDSLYEYIVHRTGRLVLFTWESSVLGKKNSLMPILW